MPCIMGIDSGLTVTKAVIFDADGTVLAIARRRVPQIIPAPQYVERDMDGLWAATADAICEAVASVAGRLPISSRSPLRPWRRYLLARSEPEAAWPCRYFSRHNVPGKSPMPGTRARSAQAHLN